MRFPVRLFMLFALLIVFLPVQAFADGKTFIIRDDSLFLSVVEREQIAAISHRDGIEKMIIAVNFEAKDTDKALWIFPVPGTPDQVTFDVVESFPEFSGYDPRPAAEKRIKDLMFLTRVPILIAPFVEGLLEALTQEHFFSEIKGLGMASYMAVDRVVVHREMEKAGIHIESITAKSTEALADYLKEKRTEAPVDELSTFEPYLNDEYVLIVAWIASGKELTEKFPEYHDSRSISVSERWPCLYVKFPTDRAFFPLRPTSAYGDVVIPVRLFVIGHVQPETSEALAEQTKVAHFLQGSFPEGTHDQFAENLTEERIPYTSVLINAAAKNFTEDLWFSPVHIRGFEYAEKLLDPNSIEIPPFLGIPIAIGFVAFVSYVSAGISGLLAFHEWKMHARLGLWNLLTYLGFMLASERFFRKRGINPKRHARASAFIYFYFQFVYVAITLLFQVPLQLPLGLPLGPSIIYPLGFPLLCGALIIIAPLWTFATRRFSNGRQAE